MILSFVKLSLRLLLFVAVGTFWLICADVWLHQDDPWKALLSPYRVGLFALDWDLPEIALLIWLACWAIFLLLVVAALAAALHRSVVRWMAVSILLPGILPLVLAVLPSWSDEEEEDDAPEDEEPSFSYSMAVLSISLRLLVLFLAGMFWLVAGYVLLFMRPIPAGLVEPYQHYFIGLDWLDVEVPLWGVLAICWLSVNWISRLLARVLKRKSPHWFALIHFLLPGVLPIVLALLLYFP